MLREYVGEEGRRRHRLDLGLLVQRLVEAHALFGATEAGMPNPHWPGVAAHVAELDGRTVGVGLWPLAAELVETPALAMALIAELLGEASGVKVRSAFAVVVDQPTIGEQRSALGIECG